MPDYLVKLSQYRRVFVSDVPSAKDAIQKVFEDYGYNFQETVEVHDLIFSRTFKIDGSLNITEVTVEDVGDQIIDPTDPFFSASNRDQSQGNG